MKKMPCKKSKQVGKTGQAEMVVEAEMGNRTRNNIEKSVSNRKKNNIEKSVTNGTKKNIEKSVTNRTKNNTTTLTSNGTSTMNQIRTTNEMLNSTTDRFVLLRDERTSRHFMFHRDQLSSSKKDDFKVGTYATCQDNGDESTPCRGVIVLAGERAKMFLGI